MPADARTDVLFVTVTKVETQAVLAAFDAASRPRLALGGRVYFDLGTVKGARVHLTQSEMGSGGLGAAQQAVQQGIAALSPVAVVMIGIAFGVNERKQDIGDVLVTNQLLLYDLQRAGTRDSAVELVLRGDKPHASPWLLNLARSAEVAWTGSPVRFGPVLTGDKLVDNVDFRDQLRAFEPHAIGGEMEGAGLYVACAERKVDWLLTKAICDWGDGNKAADKDQRQAIAAKNAAAFAHHVLHFVEHDWQAHRAPSQPTYNNDPGVPSPQTHEDPPLTAPTSARSSTALTHGAGYVAPPPSSNLIAPAGWLYGIRAWWPSVLSVLLVLGVGRVVWKGNWHDARNWCDGFQLAVVFAVFVHALHNDPRELTGDGWAKDDDRKQCGECLDQFMLQWRMLWASWTAFYVVHCVRHVVEKWAWEPNSYPPWGYPPWWGVGVTWILDLMHVVQSVMLVILFWTMIRPTFTKESRRKAHLVLLFGVIIVGLFTSADALFLWLTGGLQGVPVAGLAVALILGVAVATAMGLLVGRLESRHLTVGPFELALLYLYTGTQPLFRVMVWMEYGRWASEPLVHIAHGADFWLKLLALAMKLGLYSVVYRQIKSGRLALYMLKVRVQHEEMQKQWEDFERDRLGPLGP